MLYRMFEKRKTMESVQLLEDMSRAYKSMKVFSETPRKPRQINMNMTGSEMGVLTFSVFPVLIKKLMRFTSSHW